MAKYRFDGLNFRNYFIAVIVEIVETARIGSCKNLLNQFPKRKHSYGFLKKSSKQFFELKSSEKTFPFSPYFPRIPEQGGSNFINFLAFPTPVSPSDECNSTYTDPLVSRQLNIFPIVEDSFWDETTRHVSLSPILPQIHPCRAIPRPNLRRLGEQDRERVVFEEGLERLGWTARSRMRAPRKHPFKRKHPLSSNLAGTSSSFTAQQAPSNKRRGSRERERHSPPSLSLELLKFGRKDGRLNVSNEVNEGLRWIVLRFFFGRFLSMIIILEWIIRLSII